MTKEMKFNKKSYIGYTSRCLLKYFDWGTITSKDELGIPVILKKKGGNFTYKVRITIEKI